MTHRVVAGDEEHALLDGLARRLELLHQLLRLHGRDGVHRVPAELRNSKYNAGKARRRGRCTGCIGFGVCKGGRPNPGYSLAAVWVMACGKISHEDVA